MKGREKRSKASSSFVVYLVHETDCGCECLRCLCSIQTGRQAGLISKIVLWILGTGGIQRVYNTKELREGCGEFSLL